MKAAIRIFSQVYSIVLLGLISYEVWEDGRAYVSNVFLGLSALLLLASFLAMFIGVFLKNRSLLIVAALASCPTLLEGIYRALRGLPAAEENIFLILITWPVLFFGYRAIQEGNLLPSQDSIRTNLSKRLLPGIAALTSPFIILGVISFSGIFPRPGSCNHPMECLKAVENTAKWWNLSGDSYLPGLESMCEQGVPRACLYLAFYPEKVGKTSDAPRNEADTKERKLKYTKKWSEGLAEATKLKSESPIGKGNEERLAALFEESHSPDARVRLLKFLALEHSDSLATLELAIEYSNGNPAMKLEKDIHLAEKLFRWAIRGGSYHAVERLGDLYSQGGAPHFNVATAMGQWREACRLGASSGCRKVGAQYSKRNSAEALYWFTLGAQLKECASILEAVRTLPKNESGNSIVELSFLLLAGDKNGELCRARRAELEASMGKGEIEAASIASKRLAEEMVIRRGK